MSEYGKAVKVACNHVIYLLFFFIQLVVISHGCHESERNALLSFKSLLQDPSSRLSSWQVGSNQNCCDWRGIQCSTNSLHVISIDLRNSEFDIYLQDKVSQFIPYDDILAFQHRTSLSGTISPSLLEIPNIEYLDLSLNRFSFPKEISYNFSFLKRLMHLDLSYSGFDGSITTQFANLSSLQYLDISSVLKILEIGDGSIRLYSSFISTKSSSTNWVRGLVKLKVLRLSDVNLYEARENWAEPISFLRDLTELHLSHCSVGRGPFPTNEIANLSRLSSLKLDSNYFNCPFPRNLSSISSLSVLDLSGCGLQGSVPYFPQLKHLQVSRNDYLQLNLTLMFELQKHVINKSTKSGSTPSFILSAPRMVSLIAAGCSIQGSLPATSNFQQLQSLDLSYNNITGAIPESLCDNLPLRVINLAHNNITGSFPSCITKLQNLSRFDISYNYIKGIVLLRPLINELNLTRLNLNSNKLHVELGQHPLLSAKFSLQMLELRSCYLHGSIPAFFCNFTNLDKLDLSKNNLTGAIPACLFDGPKNLTYINLSRNKLSGPLPPPPQNIIVFDLSQNKLTGEISTETGKRLFYASSIYLSDNELSGLIPCSICLSDKKHLFSTLESLDLSNNHLSGAIPSCLVSCTDLRSLNLGMNNFTGDVPILFISNLEVLELNDNRLAGAFPNFFDGLDHLEVLNLANNNFEGAIPTSIGSFRDLRILSLRSNNFNGSIPNEITDLQKLQILDLSINNFSGRIPGNMSNWDMLIRRQNKTFVLADPFLVYGFSDLELEMVLKGIVMYFKYVYNYHSGIDLSCNNFEGNIPEEIVLLKGLAMLNLSYNRFSGNIPGNVGDMLGLESLDLRFNKLSGPIPQSMTSLDFLGYLNLSFNNLSGRIPRGHHFETLSIDGSAFFGNDLLCGVPTNKSCEGNDTFTDIKDDEHPMERLLYYGVVATGFVVGFWGLFIVLLIKKEKWWSGYWRAVDTIAARITG